MKLKITAVLVAVALLATVPAMAHHSFSSFWYMDRSVSIEGVVTVVRLVNPHPEMKVEVTEANGEKSVWNITGRATGSAIVKAGWTAETLPIGTKVTVEGAPSRKEGAKALAAGKITMMDSGKIVWFGGGGGIPQG